MFRYIGNWIIGSLCYTLIAIPFGVGFFLVKKWLGLDVATFAAICGVAAYAHDTRKQLQPLIDSLQPSRDDFEQ